MMTTIQIVAEYGYRLLSVISVMAAAAFAVYDVRRRRVPNKALVAFLALVLLTEAAGLVSGKTGSTSGFLLSSLLGGAAAGGVMLLCAVITHGVGGGDVKFAAVFGVLLGVSGVLLQLIGVCVLLIVYIAVVFIRQKLTHKPRPDTVAFVPFLVGGAVLGVLFFA